MSDLLEDEVYKKYFCTPPRLPKKVKHEKPWRLFVQRKKDNKWATKDFATYAEAFKFYKSLVKKGLVRDAAINSRSVSYAPPNRTVRVRGKFVMVRGQKMQVTKRVVWEPQLDPNDVHDYLWCSYCRRPTAFGYYTSHHALNHLKRSGITIDPAMRRCHICGASERLIENPTY